MGTVDKLGTAYIDPVIATGYGAYIATPLLRKAYDENNEMTEQQAADVLHKCMEVLFMRDARSFPRVNLFYYSIIKYNIPHLHENFIFIFNFINYFAELTI